MNHTGKTIARNAGILMATQLATWVLTLILTVVMPRYLGPVNVGKIAFAGSVWAIAGVLITFGMDTLITKEVARRAERAAGLLGTTLVLRGILYAVAWLGVTAYLLLFQYPPETILVAWIVGVGLLVWQMIGALQAVLQGLERMEFISIGNIAGKGVNTVAGITLLLLRQGVYVIAGVGVLASLVTFAIEWVFLRRSAPARLNFRLADARAMLKASAPYFLTGVFLVLYMQLDIVIISLLATEQAVGWYSTADQLFGTFLFIPTVFMTAIFPALSRLYAEGSQSLPKLIRKSFDLLLVLSVPIGLGLFVVADPLALLLFGPDFAGTGPVLALMGIVLILTYQNMLIGQFLISTDRQNAWTVVMAAATLATLPLDLALVPWCQQQFGNGAIGGALSFIVTEAGMTIAGLVLLPRGSLGRSNAWVAARALAAGAVMAGAAWLARWQFILLPIAIGAAVYVGLVLLLRVVDREDQALLLSTAAGVMRRFRRNRRPAPAAGEGAAG
jgi:O-antigen/teichoic acid export membrane protein